MSEASESWGQRLARGLMGVVFVAYALVCAILLFVDRNIRLFGGFCGRDSGIGPAQRAKTTIWN
jgi:hypothetical protein